VAARSTTTSFSVATSSTATGDLLHLHESARSSKTSATVTGSPTIRVSVTKQWRRTLDARRRGDLVLQAPSPE